MKHITLQINKFPSSSEYKVVEIYAGLFSEAYCENLETDLADKLQNVYDDYKYCNQIIKITNNKHEPIDKDLLNGIRLFERRNGLVTIKTSRISEK